MGISIEEYKSLLTNGLSNKSPYRQLQGKINRELGKNFEEQVEAICEVYELNNLARIEKTPEPMKILQHIENGRFEAVFTKSAQPDFKGTLKGGRTVVFDAKFTENDRITFSALSDFQRNTLLTYNNLDAIAFVLVGFGDGKVYKIDINIWDNMKEKFGRKYIKQEELDELGFGVTKTKNGIMDFLEILRYS